MEDKDKIKQLYDKNIKSENNIKDVRDLIKISNKLLEYSDDHYYLIIEKLEEQLNKEKKLKKDMTDLLLNFSKYLKNIGKLDNFIKGKGDNLLLTVLKELADGKTRDCLEEFEPFKETALYYGLIDYFNYEDRFIEDIE